MNARVTPVLTPIMEHVDHLYRTAKTHVNVVCGPLQLEYSGFFPLGQKDIYCKEVVRLIRQEKPDILVTCDPNLLYSMETRINHPDHRAAGQVVLDAAFPAAGNRLYYPELLEEGLEPHTRFPRADLTSPIHPDP